ncbi:MAG: glycosyltransferase 87 family protein [Myxococcota bacterium]
MGEPSISDQNGLDVPDWAVWLAWAVLISCLVAETVHRIFYGYVPRDLSAYLAAADTFMAGGDPYTDDIFDSTRYQGYVYVYPPGTLPLVGVLDYLSAELVSTLDLWARSAVLLGALHWLRRRFSVSAPMSILVFLALLYEPVLVDFRAGNLPTYLLAAFLVCVHMSHTPWRAWHAAAGIVAGLALAFKPMWLAPALLVLLLRRRWGALGSALLGASVIGGLTVVHLDFVPTWLARIEQLTIRYRSAVLLNLHPVLWGAALTAWLAGAVALVRKLGLDDDRLWLWLCISVVVWLRAGTYSYVLFLPVFFFWWRRFGLRRAALAFVVTLGPLPWMLRAFDHFQTYGWLQLAWGIAVGVVLFWQLHRDDAERDDAERDDAERDDAERGEVPPRSGAVI